VAKCPFCEIVNRDDPDAREVYRDEYVVGFFPKEPATLGHTLVVPRAHVPDIWNVEEGLAAHLGRAVLRLSGAVRRALKPGGLNIIQSNGEVATQTVYHLHVHLVPRWFGDGMGPIWPSGTTYTEAQKDDAWQRLREECGKGGGHG
jgi:histidine triad (HIT) family protein